MQLFILLCHLGNVALIVFGGTFKEKRSQNLLIFTQFNLYEHSTAQTGKETLS